MSTPISTPGLYDSRGQPVVIISVFFTALSFLIVVARLVTRFIMMKCQGPEDWIIMVAMAGSIGLTICTVQQVNNGLGKHFVTLSPEDGMLGLKFLWGAIMIYYFSLGLIKVSVLIQYLRIFPAKSMRITCYALLSLVITYTIISVFIVGMNCRPIALFWNKSLEGKCVNDTAFWFANASFNILSDLAIMIAPLPMLKALCLGRKQKIAVFGIFAVGGFTIFVSILRLKSLYTISVSTDPTWDNVGAATWSSLECNTALICACLPVLRPLIAKFFTRAFRSSINNTATSGTFMDSRNGRSRISQFKLGSKNADDFHARAMEEGRENRNRKASDAKTLIETMSTRKGSDSGLEMAEQAINRPLSMGLGGGIKVTHEYVVRTVSNDDSERTLEGHETSSQRKGSA